MPDLLIHLLIPLSALLLFYDERYRIYVILLAPLTIVPDLDHAITVNLERALFHNVFILLPTLMIALISYVTRDINNSRDMWNRRYNIAVIATFYLLSHLILDSFDGGVALFYPLSIHEYPFVFELIFTSGHLVPRVGVGLQALRTGGEYAIDSLGVGVLLTFLAGALFSYRRK